MSKLDEMIKESEWQVNWLTGKLEEEVLKLEALKEKKEKSSE
tara:strand:- start:57 stop:182 length:126 start_codon:yes stop_codon:yes gene_type:complete